MTTKLTIQDKFDLWDMVYELVAYPATNKDLVIADTLSAWIDSHDHN